MTQKILLTGGAGFIGSHTAVELLKAGYDIVILDTFINSHRRVIGQIERLTNKSLKVIEGDVRNRTVLTDLFATFDVMGVVHFAGLKAVGESVAKPALYYDVNVGGTVALLQAMEEAKVGSLVFSSSATVYGDPAELPLTESAPYRPANPYGRSKMWVEQAMADATVCQDECAFLTLRYFNPVGAHESGEIGEDPAGIPSNLFPYVAQVAIGHRKYLTVFGDDYATHDGTGVRDYIHVVDLARGHVAALAYVLDNPTVGYTEVNLGTGKGSSVFEVCDAFERASGKVIAKKIGPRRPGDVAAYWADPSKAKTLLGWSAKFNLDRMCVDAWRWKSTHPLGYAGMESVRGPET